MIKKLIFPIILIAVVVLGGVGADFLRNKSSAPSGHAEPKASHAKKDKKSKKDDGHSKPKKKKKKKKKKGGHGDEDGGDSDGATTYMNFKRQFVVPVMNHGATESLILLNLNLELGPDAPENPYLMEPKLRDALMRALLRLSHEGVFSGDLTSAKTYDEIQITLLESVSAILGQGLKSVLILDLSRQDQ